MTRDLKIRLFCAGALLATGLSAAVVGAQLGVVDLTAGDMKIIFGRSENGLVMDIAARRCPPDCGLNINWRPPAEGRARLSGALSL